MVVRVWKVPAFLNPYESSSVEMVLVDKKGGKIHAAIRKHLINMFESKIEERRVYEMSNFTVVPLCVCFAMTISKSQGQTLDHVGLYLPRPVFTHDQLYVSVSRVKIRYGIKILITDGSEKPQTSTVNVVYLEVFQRI
ncbi:hypothetical protein QL285_048158 [Trifolium repens]|nr:hypothetical protein QL285_048158 [Trifolium repens]